MALHELKPAKTRLRPAFFLLSLFTAAALAACGGGAGSVTPAQPSASAYTSPYVLSATQPMVQASAVAWPQTYHDGGHTGYNPSETALSITTVAGLKELNGLTMPGNAAQAMSLSGAGKLFVIGASGGPGNTLSAFNASTLKPVWSVNVGQTNSPGLATLAIDGNVVVTLCGLKDTGGSSFDGVCGYNTSTGALVWSWRNGGCNCFPESSMATPVTYAAGKLYFGYSFDNSGTEQNLLVSLNARTGAQNYAAVYPNNYIWQYAPAVGDGLVFYACYPSFQGVCAFDAATGALKWQYNSGTVENALSYSNGTLYSNYTTANETGVVALNATTGAAIRSYTTCGQNCGNGPFPVAVAKGMLYVTEPNGSLYAFKTAGGAPVWSLPSEGGAGSPSVANGVVYEAGAGANTPTLRAHNAVTGAVLWTSPYVGAQNGGVPGAAPPIVANGTVYGVSSVCGTVCSFTVH